MGLLTFQRPLTVVVRNLSSRMMDFHTPGEAGVVIDIVVEAVSVRYPDYLVPDCIGWGMVVGFLC